jgi:hypothetical protein
MYTYCCVYSARLLMIENLPKHVEFYSKNKFEKSVHLVAFIIWINHDERSSECIKKFSSGTLLLHGKVIQVIHFPVESYPQQTWLFFTLSYPLDLPYLSRVSSLLVLVLPNCLFTVEYYFNKFFISCISHHFFLLYLFTVILNVS